jgi:hypothetical protein
VQPRSTTSREGEVAATTAIEGEAATRGEIAGASRAETGIGEEQRGEVREENMVQRAAGVKRSRERLWEGEGMGGGL